jgi:hypothetical protein
MASDSLTEMKIVYHEATRSSGVIAKALPLAPEKLELPERERMGLISVLKA